MGGDATGLRRPALADVLAALVPYKPLESSREQWWRGAKHIAFEQREGLLCVTPYGTGPWFPVVPSDTREALELLHVRGLAPEDDERRAFREVLQNQAKGALFETLNLDRPWPADIPDLVAYASLSVPTILRAEELARETVARLRPWGCPQTERVVWRVGKRTEDRNQRAWKGAERHLLCTGFVDKRIGPVSMWPDGECKPAHAPWEMGLQLDSITADAITLVVPPIGGSS